MAKRQKKKSLYRVSVSLLKGVKASLNPAGLQRKVIRYKLPANHLKTKHFYKSSQADMVLVTAPCEAELA